MNRLDRLDRSDRLDRLDRSDRLDRLEKSIWRSLQGLVLPRGDEKIILKSGESWLLATSLRACFPTISDGCLGACNNSVPQ